MHVCCRDPMPAATLGTAASCKSTVIVEVSMVSDESPIWWRAQQGPPPAPWVDVFENFTSPETADAWGLAAAIFVARTRRRTDRGPTFAELFAELLPDTDGVPAAMPSGLNYAQRARLVKDFRIYAAITWKRRGWISWDVYVARSLRVGRTFREVSRERQRLRQDLDGLSTRHPPVHPRHGD